MSVEGTMERAFKEIVKANHFVHEAKQLSSFESTFRRSVTWKVVVTVRALLDRDADKQCPIIFCARGLLPDYDR